MGMKLIGEVPLKLNLRNTNIAEEPVCDFELLSKKSSQLAQCVKRRLKYGAKRLIGDITRSVKDSSPFQKISLRDAKNSRRPRSRYGRGLPKKGGAGGKGTWGEPGIELGVEDVDINEDMNDPNYDSESLESCELESMMPELTEEDLEKKLNPIFVEYFEHGDTEEVIISIQELNAQKIRPLILVFAITLALERKPSHREMTSVLLSDLYGKIFLEEDVAIGFDLLLEKLADLVLDTPDASLALGNFIARAVADDCLPPKFIHAYKKKVEHTSGRICLEHANTLLNMKHGLVRLDSVWGIGGGMCPVKYLVKQIRMLLNEYICSGDIKEATRCLQELEVPHFHHEIIYEAAVMVIESMSEKIMEEICKLLRSLSESFVISADQFENGFNRVFAEMPDICIDVPPAYTVLKQFVAMCDNYGFLPMELLRRVPVRGRKRFVSEGDGGLVKE